MSRIFEIVAISGLFLTSVASADNWGHWRGPTGNGVALNANPPIEWNESKNVKWKVKLPSRENSSPVVWGDRVFIVAGVSKGGKQTSEPTEMEFETHCYSRKNGDLLWKKVVTSGKPHQKTHETNGFTSASPCTDGKHVYAHFGSRGLYCYTLDGNLVWKRDDFGKMETLNGFGEGSSPTIEGETIIVPWDHQGPSALYLLNKQTGDTIWKTDRDEPTGWATPLVVEHAGRKQIIMNGENFARGYDFETGTEIWRCTGQTKRPIASPVHANGVVYVGSGFQGAFLGAFGLDGKGDIKGTDKVKWVIDHDVPDMASPLLTNGRIYFHKGKSSAILSCVDAETGKPHYVAKRIKELGDDKGYGSPVAAGGHIYLTGWSGTTVVIKNSDTLEIVATNPLNELIGATPAPVDDELIVRGERYLYCFKNMP